MSINRILHGMLALFFLTHSVQSSAHSVSESKARKQLQIPELLLADEPLHLKKSHLHLATVEVESRPGGGRYTCEPLNNRQVFRVWKIIQDTLRATKVDHLSTLEYLIVCSRVTVNNRAIGGFPVPPLNLLMLNISNFKSEDQIKRLFWHEYYHFVEIKTGTYDDVEWGRQFGGYDNQYRIWQSNAQAIGSGDSGFINHYGQSFSREERAELAAYLMTDPDALTDYIDRTQDLELRKKVLFMQKKLETLGF